MKLLQGLEYEKGGRWEGGEDEYYWEGEYCDTSQ